MCEHLQVHIIVQWRPTCTRIQLYLLLADRTHLGWRHSRSFLHWTISHSFRWRRDSSKKSWAMQEPPSRPSDRTLPCRRSWTRCLQSPRCQAPDRARGDLHFYKGINLSSNYFTASPCSYQDWSFVERRSCPLLLVASCTTCRNQPQRMTSNTLQKRV